MKRRSPRRKKVFKVGDHVYLTFGTRKVKAVVTEDRGPLGVGGTRILRVRLLSIDPEREFEVGVDEVSATA